MSFEIAWVLQFFFFWCIVHHSESFCWILLNRFCPERLPLKRFYHWYAEICSGKYIGNITGMHDILSNILCNHSQGKVYIMGDFDFDLFKCDWFPKCYKYADATFSSGYNPLIYARPRELFIVQTLWLIRYGRMIRVRSISSVLIKKRNHL